MSIQTKEAMVIWVRTNITKDPTLISMSSYVGYSPYYCSAKFREYTGMTYKLFLSKCRLQAAVGDLMGTNDRITDIAFRYGYATAESLTRAFTAVYQCSPRQYRNQFKHKGNIHVNENRQE